MADRHRDFFKVAVFERGEHKATLALLEETMRRVVARSAAGTKAIGFCKLCERGPASVPLLQWRASCPCRQARERAQSELDRLARPLRLHEPIPESHADKAGAECESPGESDGP